MTARTYEALYADALPFFADLGPTAAAETADVAARLLMLRDGDPGAYRRLRGWIVDEGPAVDLDAFQQIVTLVAQGSYAQGREGERAAGGVR